MGASGGMIGTIVGGAMGTVGGIFSSIAGIKADQKLSSLLKEQPLYTGSNAGGFLKDMYGLAQNRLNGRMAGAGQMERNIYGNQANTIAATNRYATDSSQATAAALAAQGQGDQAFQNMQLQEAADYNNRYGQLNDSANSMTNFNLGEDRYKHEDSVRNWGNRINTVMTQYKMRQAGGQSFTNMGGAAQSGLSGMGGMGGG